MASRRGAVGLWQHRPFALRRLVSTGLYWGRWTPSLGTLGLEVSQGRTTEVHARV